MRQAVGRGGIAPPHLRSGEIFANKMATEARCGAAFTLNEVIRTIRPIHSLHAYFTCDADFLFECYAERELRRQPMTVILGERWGTDADEFRAACSSAFPAHNVTVVSAPLPLTWGSHHSKLSMFEDEAGAVHILIGTANLTRGDWCDHKELFFYVAGEARREERRHADVPLITDLQRYLNAAYGSVEQVRYWSDRLSCTRFAPMPHRIVASWPGCHRGEAMHKVGHMSLRDALWDASLSMLIPAAVGRPLGKALIAQATSIGSLGVNEKTWLCAEFVKSMRGGDDGDEPLYVVYPTERQILASEMRAAPLLTYARQTHARQRWLQNFLAEWSGDALPHTKTYARADTGTPGGRPDWMLLTSANLSRAAWGVLEQGGTQLRVRSYELGVLFIGDCRLPFDFPLSRYSRHDKPWTI